MNYRMQVVNLSKSFGDKKVLNSIDFEIQHGECFSLLGANGAGKSTCISILLNYLKHDSGSVHIDGLPHDKAETKLHRSCLPQESQFIEGIKVKEILSYVRRLYPDPLDIESVVKDFQLEKILNTPSQLLSGGQKRLLGLALAFIGNTKLVLLDEPTTGLDAELRNCVWARINQFKESGGSILLTTHNLEEAEILSDRIAFLEQGNIIGRGTLEELKNQTKQKNIRFKYSGSKILPSSDLQSFEENNGFYKALSDKPESFLKDLLNKYEVEQLVVEDIKLDQIMNSIRKNA